MTQIRLRRVRDAGELVATFDAIGRQFDPPYAAPDRRLEALLARFADDRRLQLAVLDDEASFAGGVLAFRHADDPGTVTVRSIGVDAALRGCGVGRLLLEIVELEALRLGCREIRLGAADDARGFYERLGYRGRHKMRSKALPPQGRLTDLRIATASSRLGDPDLDAGLAYDGAFGGTAGRSTTKAEPGSAR